MHHCHLTWPLHLSPCPSEAEYLPATHDKCSWSVHFAGCARHTKNVNNLTHCLTVQTKMIDHAVLRGLAECISKCNIFGQAAIQGDICDTAETEVQVGVRHAPVSGDNFNYSLDCQRPVWLPMYEKLTCKNSLRWLRLDRSPSDKSARCAESSGIRLVVLAVGLH